MPTLPLELYHCIIGFVDRQGTGKKDLKTLSLVCRAFRLESQKTLFHALSLQSSDSIDKLSKVKSLKSRHPRLASYLRAVTVVIRPPDVTPPDASGIYHEKLSFIASALLIFQDQTEVLLFQVVEHLVNGVPLVPFWSSLPKDLRTALTTVFYHSPLRMLGIHGVRCIPLHWLIRPSPNLHDLHIVDCTASASPPTDQVAVTKGAPLRIQHLAIPVDLSGLDMATAGLRLAMGEGMEHSWLDAASLEQLRLLVHQPRHPLPLGNQPGDPLRIMPPEFLARAEKLYHLFIEWKSVFALFSPDYFKILHKGAMSTLTTMTMKFYQIYSESLGSACLNFFDTLAAFPNNNVLTNIEVELNIDLPLILEPANGRIRLAPIPPSAEWDRIVAILTPQAFPALNNLRIRVCMFASVDAETLRLIQSDAWGGSGGPGDFGSDFVTALFHHLSQLKKRLAQTYPTLDMDFQRL